MEVLISAPTMSGVTMSPAGHSAPGPAGPLDITVSVGSGPEHHIVTVHGDLDLTTAMAVADQLTGLLDGGCTAITVDMRQVSFCDVVGLRVLLRISDALDDRAGRFLIVGACPSLRLMLDVLPELGVRPPSLADAPA